MNWQRIVAIITAILGVIFGGVASYGGGAISYGAADATTGNYLTTGLAGLGSLGSLIVSAIMTWRSGSGVSPTRAAQIAALSTLAATCMATGDIEGTRLVGQLADHFKSVADGKTNEEKKKDGFVIPSVQDILKMLENRLRNDAASAISLDSLKQKIGD